VHHPERNAQGRKRLGRELEHHRPLIGRGPGPRVKQADTDPAAQHDHVVVVLVVDVHAAQDVSLGIGQIPLAGFRTIDPLLAKDFGQAAAMIAVPGQLRKTTPSGSSIDNPSSVCSPSATSALLVQQRDSRRHSFASPPEGDAQASCGEGSRILALPEFGARADRASLLIELPQYTLESPLSGTKRPANVTFASGAAPSGLKRTDVSPGSSNGAGAHGLHLYPDALGQRFATLHAGGPPLDLAREAILHRIDHRLQKLQLGAEPLDRKSPAIPRVCPDLAEARPIVPCRPISVTAARSIRRSDSFRRRCLEPRIDGALSESDFLTSTSCRSSMVRRGESRAAR